MEVKKGNYLIGVGQETKRPVLFKAESINKGIVSGTIQKDAHIKSKQFQVEMPVKDIILSLGDDPYPGKVYGYDTSMIYRGRKTHPFYGPLYWFYSPEKDVGASMMKVMDKTEKVLRQNKLDFIVQPGSCIWEVLPFNGEKYAGMYKRMKNPEKSPHRLQIRPEIMPSSEWAYIIYHELGHHLHFEFVTGKKINAQWLQLFKSTINVSSIRKEKSQELLDALLSQEDPPSAFKANLSEEDTAVYKLILKTISQQHSVTVKELDILFEAQYFDEIRGVWPIRGVSKKDLAPVISEYACKNYRETFAEAFAYRMVGKKLPKSVESLLDRSISYAKANHEKH
jgi:hypothetical protein